MLGTPDRRVKRPLRIGAAERTEQSDAQRGVDGNAGLCPESVSCSNGPRD